MDVLHYLTYLYAFRTSSLLTFLEGVRFFHTSMNKETKTSEEIIFAKLDIPSPSCPVWIVATTALGGLNYDRRVQNIFQAQRYTPPSPPVAFTVPWDVFYPFFMSSTSGARRTTVVFLSASRFLGCSSGLVSSVLSVVGFAAVLGYASSTLAQSLMSMTGLL